MNKPPKPAAAPTASTEAPRSMPPIPPKADLYRVVFDACGPFRAGDVASASALGNVAYLLSVGAIAPVD